jgi:acetylornithine deacetylase/succinyl-diaminopimelate desuccinylase family protein
MVSFNTVNEPGNEDPLAKYLGSELENLGFSIRLVPCGDYRSSLVAFKGDPNGIKLLFNGHLDVVSVSNNWSSDPFILTQEGDRLYGRGTADMKGGIASMIAAVGRLAEERFDYAKGQLILTFVADEELYNKGTRSVLELPEVKNADYAIIGEPTDLNICIGHRGTARSVIRVNGRPCHSSKPELGINAISLMSNVIQAIDRHHEELKKITHSVLPSPSMAVVMIEGGEKDNIIPGHCEIKFDRRTLPSDTKQSVQEEISALLDSIGGSMKEFSYDILPYIYLEAGEVSPDSLVVTKSKKAYEKVFGREAVLSDFSATCEQSLFMNQGIETMIFGPGHLDQAHVDDEFTTIPQLNAAADFYYAVIKEFLA